MTGFLAATDLVYARRSRAAGELIGGFAEHWDVVGPGGAIVATVDEDLSVLDRAGRLLSSRFAREQRHRLQVRDAAGPLFAIVKPVRRVRRDYAEVRDADDAPAGTVTLIGTGDAAGVGLGLYDPRDVRLGEARPDRAKSDASGHRTYEVLDAEGGRIGEFAATTTRGRAERSGYRLQVSVELAEPLCSLVRAAPVVWYFLQ